MSRRVERIRVLLRKQIGEIIISQMNDPRLASLITITGVEVSGDLGYAKVFTSSMGSPEEARIAIDTLNKAAGYLRRELRERIILRHIPRLQFVFDDSIEKGQHLLELISNIRAKDIDEGREDG
jgi:ribosome-binding factor A